jgi:hypothetical protein
LTCRMNARDAQAFIHNFARSGRRAPARRRHMGGRGRASKGIVTADTLLRTLRLTEAPIALWLRHATILDRLPDRSDKLLMPTFVGFVRRDVDHGFAVTFPDLPSLDLHKPVAETGHSLRGNQ